MNIKELIGLFKKYSETTTSISEQEGEAPAAAPAGDTGGG